MVSSCSLYRLVLAGCVRRTFNGGILHPHVVTDLPTNLARLRRRSLSGIVRSTNNEGVAMVRKPLTVTFNLKLSFSMPRKALVISVNTNAASITMVSLNNVTTYSSFGVTSFSFSARVVHCMEHRCGVRVNPLATRTVGVGINDTIGHSIRVTVITGNEGVFSNLPRDFRVASNRICRTVGSALGTVYGTVHRILGGASPSLITSVVDSNVCLANNNSRLSNFTRQVSSFLGVRIRRVRSPTRDIMGNTTITVGGPRLLGGISCRVHSVGRLRVR